MTAVGIGWLFVEERRILTASPVHETSFELIEEIQSLAVVDIIFKA